jgi:CP family cyanate transporter-like MFS transporter
MQGGGFVLAALPPWLVAVLHDLTGGYLAGWSWHLACIGLVAVLTAGLKPGGYAAAMPPLSAGAQSPAPVRA